MAGRFEGGEWIEDEDSGEVDAQAIAAANAPTGSGTWWDGLLPGDQAATLGFSVDDANSSYMNYDYEWDAPAREGDSVSYDGDGRGDNGFVDGGTTMPDPTKEGYFEKLGTSISDWILKNPGKSMEGLLTTLGTTYANDQRKQAEDAKLRAASDLLDKKNQHDKEILAEKDKLDAAKLAEQRRYNNASITAMPDQRGIIQSALRRNDGTNVFDAQGKFVRG